jgi:hypothetical protein
VYKVGSKEVKEIMDQMLEGDGITTKHIILPEMFRDMQLLDPMEGNDHDFVKSSNCFIIEGKKRAGGLQGQKKAKNSGASVETKGKEEEDDPYSLEVGGKDSKAPPSQSKNTLLAHYKGKTIIVKSLLPQFGGTTHRPATNKITFKLDL